MSDERRSYCSPIDYCSSIDYCRPKRFVSLGFALSRDVRCRGDRRSRKFMLHIIGWQTQQYEKYDMQWSGTYDMVKVQTVDMM